MRRKRNRLPTGVEVPADIEIMCRSYAREVWIKMRAYDSLPTSAKKMVQELGDVGAYNARARALQPQPGQEIL